MCEVRVFMRPREAHARASHRWPTFGNTRIRIYVDGEPTSSIDFEILMAVGMTGPTLTPWGA